MRLITAAAVYFALVFGTGFVLGLLRVLVVVPRLGARVAELIEVPVMIVVTIASARWVTRRFLAGSSKRQRLVVGLLALGLVLLAEIGVGVLLLGPADVATSLVKRDPVTAAAYYGSLVLFAIMPLLVRASSRAS